MNLLTNIFKKPVAEKPEVSGAEALFAQVQKAYFAAEHEWDLAKLAVLEYRRKHPKLDAVRVVGSRAYTSINNASDPKLDRLCSAERQARAARNNLQEQYASLLFSTGRKS